MFQRGLIVSLFTDFGLSGEAEVLGALSLALLVTAAAGTPVERLLRYLDTVDVPNERSSHDTPTLRGGGIAPLVGVLSAAALSPALLDRPAIGVLVAAVCFGTMGLVEDLVGISVPIRFTLQIACAGAAVPWIAYGVDGETTKLLFATAFTLWTAAYVNAYNFMDGINGIALAQAVVAGTTWYAIGTVENVPALSAGGAIIAGAAIAFVPFNFPSARLFLGDVGSYFLGAFLATLLVVGLRAGLAIEAVVAPLAIALADTGSTLVRRVLRGDPWFLPHCEHTYQRLVRLGWSHAGTTLIVALYGTVSAALGMFALTSSRAARIGADLALIALVASYLSLPGWVRRRSTSCSPLRSPGMPAVESSSPDARP